MLAERETNVQGKDKIMGECGCYSNGQRYRLNGPRGVVYIIKLLPRCDYCCVGAAVEIERVPLWKNRWRIQDIKATPELPVTSECSDFVSTMILAGPSDDALKGAARASAYEECDEITAEILAEGMMDHLPRAPEVVSAFVPDEQNPKLNGSVRSSE